MSEQDVRLVGSEKRREDPGLITGPTRFVDDIRLARERPAMLHMVVVRSPYAHARIEKIAAESARAQPGVVDVIIISGPRGQAQAAGEHGTARDRARAPSIPGL